MELSPPTQKHKREEEASPSSTATASNIPDDLIFSEILPRLPFKSLCRFKCVCNKWSRLTFLPKSGLVTTGPNGLVFLPTSGTSLCIPKPSLNSNYRAKLIASANGLLCLELKNPSVNHKFLYVYNPGTKDGHQVPESQRRYCAALSFDPLGSSSRYKLIRAVCEFEYMNQLYPYIIYPRRTINGKLEFTFETFSSDTGKWVASSARVSLRNFIRRERSVYVRGVVFWDCYNQLMSYDTEKDIASAIELPSASDHSDSQKMGEWEGQLTYSRVRRSIIQVWLWNGNGGNDGKHGNWEQRYRVSVQEMVDKNRDFFLSWGLLLTRNNIPEVNWKLLPLPFGGGEKLYLRVRMNRQTEEMVMSYDIKTAEVARFCMVNVGHGCADCFLSYTS